MSIFLSAHDVAILTGRKIKSAQIAALRKMGLPFFVNAAGRPIVTRSAVEGNDKATTGEITKWTMPDLTKKKKPIAHGRSGNQIAGTV